ncbi:MAG: zf-TFIIB domain-containing protein [Deltaproteobacteria bacterium]|jgi:phage host-nuclease inhibitor protein Gam|nr:zf-TFIIB domain-containing protein [Deltaproteobacteria bacterium]
MSKNRVLLKIKREMGDEELYFKEQEQNQIKKLREKSAEEANEKYCEEHKDHCFRCGTRSLVEVDRGDVKIDICVNKDCGAMHLDPGELEAIMKDQKSIITVSKAIFNVFK